MPLPNNSVRTEASSINAPQVLVVLSCNEGRNFPKRLRRDLIVEARFDNEVLTTDPVPHVDTPFFGQELAWELDKKSLRQHRLQRSSVKVVIWSREVETDSRESIGYVILPVNCAGSKPAPQWQPLLLNTRGMYAKTKPEIRVGVFLDHNNQTAQPSTLEGSTVNRTNETTSGPTDASYKDSTVSMMEDERKSLMPQLDDENGWYLIGNKNDVDNRTFMLSVTVAFAANLKYLLPRGVPEICPASDEDNGFFFFYTLFGNSVTTDPFFDVLAPSFPSERASVRIRSTLEKVVKFLRLQTSVEIHLCFGAQSLGRANLPLNAIADYNPQGVFMQPITIEETYKLAPKLQPAVTNPPDEFPMVGVAITFKMDESLAATVEPHV